MDRGRAWELDRLLEGGGGAPDDGVRAILHRLDQIKLLGGSIRGAISESNMELRPAKMRLESGGRETWHSGERKGRSRSEERKNKMASKREKSEERKKRDTGRKEM